MGPQILFVSGHGQFGGSEITMMRLVERLDPASVGGIVLLEEGDFARRLRDRGFEPTIVPAEGRRILGAAVQLRRRLREERPDLIHANGIKAAVVAVVASIASGVPVVWVKHDFSRDGALAHTLAFRCKRIVGVSAAVLATFHGRFQRKTTVVHNGIPTPLQRGEAARVEMVELMEGVSGRVVTIVGRLHPYKGHADLLRAVALIEPSVRDLSVAIVGEIDPSAQGYREELVALASRLGIRDRVFFTGFLDDPSTVIEGADVVAIPTKIDEDGYGREGFGLVGVEAMALGRPVVGYSEGALPEVLNGCAYLVPTGDIRALAAALEEVLTDAAVRTRLIECGSALTRDRYSLERMVAAMKDVYAGVVSG